MMIKHPRFNIYLCLALLAFMATACHSTKKSGKDKEATLIEFHMESVRDAFTETMLVPVYRTNPMYVNVNKEPLVDAAMLTDAAVIEDVGGFVIRLKFDDEGAALLNTATAANPNKHIAILCITDKSRWIAAPVITKPIRDGIYTFTPDATREEADRIVSGLKNVIKKLNKDSFPF